MTKPKVLNKNKHDCLKAVYIGRGSYGGNPYRIGQDGSREEVIEKYRQYLTLNPQVVAFARQELRGKDLACFCAPLSCHSDILLELANVPR
jgi:hypothetical protein